MIFPADTIRAFNDFENYLSVFQPTWAYRKLTRLVERVSGLFTGNQSMKTSSVTHMFVGVIFGWHPVPKRNVFYFECEKRTKDNLSPHGYKILDDGFGGKYKAWENGTWNAYNVPDNMKCPYCGSNIIPHNRKSRIIRFAAESLPTDKGGSGGQSKEIKNSVYPAFKSWLPDFIIKRDEKTGKRQDITARSPSITITDPLVGLFDGYQDNDIVVEFVSYTQQVQAGAGVQRMSIECDEEPPADFWEEQLPRLLHEDGNIIITLTPANKISWAYDDIFEKTGTYFRTEAVCEFLKTKERRNAKRVEYTNSKQDIAVIQAATDDNPSLSKQVIDDMFNEMSDYDEVAIATRRYGVFKQATGRIFKDFNYSIHVINPNQYFQNGEIPSKWRHAYTMDFHPVNNHALLFVAMSQHDEAFVYREWDPLPERWVIEKLCAEIANMSPRGVKFYPALTDLPAKATKNPNNGKTPIEEMNTYFRELKQQGFSGGAYWEIWSNKLKGIIGRDAIHKRLKNSAKVGKPFNNYIIEDGIKKRIPTIWFFDSCHECIKSIKHWRLENYATNRHLATKDKKEKPQQKWSHFCTALEGLFADKRFRPVSDANRDDRNYKYFKGNAN